MPLIRSISGLRATLGDGLEPGLILNYAASFAKYLPEGPIVVGRDGRPSGKWIENIVAGTLAACGREVRLLGIVPTPTVQISVEKTDASGGIAITASHNPENWNGMKFVGPDGVFLNADENEKFWEILDNKDFEFPENAEYNIFKIDYAIERHIDSIINLPEIKKSKKLGKKSFVVVVDAVNASGSIALPMLLMRLGCRPIELHCKRNGKFPHDPEPIAENLKELKEAVISEKADLGIAVDPDADRLTLIDDSGQAIGEEKTIALATLAVLSSLKSAKGKHVVINQSTSRMVEEIAENHGAKAVRSAVGEINVVNKMKETKAVIGGEGSGGVILPSSHYGRDSLVGTALILKLMAESEKALSQLILDLPKYYMLKDKVEFDGSLDKIRTRIKAIYKGATINTDDGLKFELPEAWIQIRKSNTEPVVRIIAEATDALVAKNLVETAKSAIK